MIDETDEFVIDRAMFTPFASHVNGYMALSQKRPKTYGDVLTMGEMETSIAMGIVRWYDRLEDNPSSIDATYWLVAMGTAWDAARQTMTSNTSEWVDFRRALWNEMRADRWLKVYDCDNADCDLWAIALIRAHGHIFKRSES